MMDADIIIVGAGTAGCVLAEALTRSGKLRVVLVEAGGAPSSPFVGIPAGFAKLFNSKLDWAYWSEPQGHAHGRRVFMPRGRMLGGSSNMNAQIHQWGHPQDFEEWRAAGCEGWGWSDVAPVMASQEAFAGGGKGRGGDGPMKAQLNAHANAASHAFVAAAGAVGTARGASYNGGAYEGAWIAEIAHDRGKRFSVFDAYLKPAMRRPNLLVLSGATAERLIFERRRAVGVVASVRGEMREVRARGGVVVAAGAFGSPALLMRSGVGPSDHLRANGVEVVTEAPGVGQNLHDHPMSALIVKTRRRDTFKAAESPTNLMRYLASKAGPLASNAAEAIAFARSSPELTAPDMELIFAPLEWREQALKPPKVHAFTVGAAVVAPRSRGAVRLAGKGLSVDLGLFSDDGGEDRRVLLMALQWARRVCAQAPLAAEITGELDPAPWTAGEDDLFAWACRTLQTVYHPAGTCRMGRGASSVVSPQLDVLGVDGLWVADASVMPLPVRGHPNAAIATIAERGAQFVAQRVERAAAA
jgi:choline dehydrogenase